MEIIGLIIINNCNTFRNQRILLRILPGICLLVRILLQNYTFSFQSRTSVYFPVSKSGSFFSCYLLLTQVKKNPSYHSNCWRISGINVIILIKAIFIVSVQIFKKSRLCRLILLRYSIRFGTLTALATQPAALMAPPFPPHNSLPRKDDSTLWNAILELAMEHWKVFCSVNKLFFTSKAD